MTTQIKLEAFPVTTPEHVQLMRLIRNSGAASFSHDHHIISAQAQRAWWVVMQGRIHAWLYQADGEVVGFGLIREQADGRWTTSAGVMPFHHGHGYGGAIVDDLVDQARARGLTLHAEALLSNPAGVKTHHLDRWERFPDADGYARFRSLP